MMMIWILPIAPIATLTITIRTAVTSVASARGTRVSLSVLRTTRKTRTLLFLSADSRHLPPAVLFHGMPVPTDDVRGTHRNLSVCCPPFLSADSLATLLQSRTRVQPIDVIMMMTKTSVSIDDASLIIISPNVPPNDVNIKNISV